MKNTENQFELYWEICLKRKEYIHDLNNDYADYLEDMREDLKMLAHKKIQELTDQARRIMVELVAVIPALIPICRVPYKGTALSHGSAVHNNPQTYSTE